MTFRLTPAAAQDLATITEQLEAENPAAAHRWLDQVEHQCMRLGEFPLMGAARDEVRPGLRLWPVGNYLILYRELGGGAEIVRVIDGRRRWERLLGQGEP